MKALIHDIYYSGGDIVFTAEFLIITNGASSIETKVLSATIPDFNSVDPFTINSLIQGSTVAYAITQSYSLSDSNVFLLDGNLMSNAGLNTLLLNPTINTAPSHSFITTAAAANGFQLSTTRPVLINYNCTIVTAATLAAGAVGTILLEVAATNSTTAADWKEMGRLTNGQVFSLAVAIGCTQTVSGQLGTVVPTGYYTRLRTINTTGTPTYTFNSGQEATI